MMPHRACGGVKNRGPSEFRDHIHQRRFQAHSLDCSPHIGPLDGAKRIANLPAASTIKFHALRAHAGLVFQKRLDG
jgi:hypothetical protein